MLDTTSVSTSYVNGLSLNMDSVSARDFLVGIALSTITLCREADRWDKESGITANMGQYDALIDTYCAGVHGAVLTAMISQNVQIIFRLMQEAVLNETSRGLYLLKRESKEDIPVWKLFPLAINEYKKFVERVYSDCTECKKFIYDKYNEDFEALMRDETDKEGN